MTDAPAAPARKMHSITLSEPIIRGETKIEKLDIRKPKSGELRGLSIAELQNANATAIMAILPRITMPTLTDQEAADLEPEDLASCAGAIIDFFMTADQRAIVAELLKG